MSLSVTRLFLLFAAIMGPSAVSAEVSSSLRQAFVGTWEYQYEFNGVGEVDVLNITQTGQEISGTYLGYERFSDHGRFSFLVRLQQLTIEQDGTISFTIGPRNVFAWRPTSVDEKSATPHGTGRMEFSFRLQGSLGRDGLLYLGCFPPESEFCSYDTRIFSKRRK